MQTKQTSPQNEHRIGHFKRNISGLAADNEL